VIGTPQKVLRDLATTINQTDAGEISLTWHTVHGRRVVEVSGVEAVEPGSGDAVRIGSEPVDYVALGLPTNATAAEVRERTTPAKPAEHPVARAFKDAWAVLFPPKQGR
jgi:hypothetical protein